MARVVQRRSNPPYLLFVFVFLFLIAATMAVIGFMKADEIEQQIASLEEDKQELQQTREQLLEESQQLAAAITGTTEGPGAAKEAAEAAVTQTGLHGGIAPELIGQHQLVQKLQEQIDDLKKQITAEAAKVQAKNDTLVEQTKKFEESLANLNTEKDALQKQLADAQADYEKRVERHGENLASNRQEMQKDIDEKNDQITRLVEQIAKKDEQIAELKATVDDMKALLTPGGTDVVNEADGKIVRVTPGSDDCYINIGSDSKVRQGMNFAVYGRGAEFKDDIKGKIRVVEVSDAISRCKIIEENEDNPITQGDGVANLAFHASRQYNFVVQGRFDLYDTGQATEFGRQAVKDAIKRFGGSLGDQLSVQTDYVVLGAEPAKPAKPAPDAPASVQRAYQEQMQQYQEYVDTLNLAQSMKIPVLNGHRFMTLTGFMPEQKPQ